MTVLAVDTAGQKPSVALISNGRLFEEPLPDDRRASEDLLPAIRRVLASAGIRLTECERIGVCAGPGSFTGVRVGLATVWALGRATGIAVEPVSTLEAMAEAARLPGRERVVAALARAIERSPQPVAEAGEHSGMTAVYSRPSAAEEKHGAA